MLLMVTGSTLPSWSGSSPEPEAPRLWSFQAVKAVTPPLVEKHAARVQNPIDQFVFSRQEKAGVPPNAPADKRTLLRRACFDLTGLPPTPEQAAAFLEDSQPDAFSTLVDRLLASKAYGERWGRYWLDLARYADTTGDATDMPIPQAAYYRDYVIDSFNQDLPYDQFINEQIAGDLLADADDGKRWEERIIATGYIALSRRYGNSKYADKHLIVENTIDTIGRSMLGMTFSCARCHDHKFDPVSTEDYYGLYGYFNGIQYPHAGTEHARYQEHMVILERDPAKRTAYKDWQARLAKAKDDLKALERKRRNDKSEELKQEVDTLKKDLDALKKADPKVRVAWAVTEQPNTAGDQRIHLSGDPDKSGPMAPRGYIQVIAQKKAEIAPKTSGRLQLAQWISDPDNPLTKRVMVNRIWQYHFGRGIVASSSSFGFQGDAPTHPDLLDWLSESFVKNGWSIKAMHRMIMNSATYQLASSENAIAQQKDEANSLFWRFDRQRLDGEAIRDAVLLVSGTLDQSAPKAHPFPERSYEKFSQGGPFMSDYETDQRSVYMMTRRNGKHPYWELFDAPDRGQSTASRRVSTVPMQALFMMNSDFAKEKAARFATRIQREAKEPHQRVQRAYQLALGRPASDLEATDALDHIKAVGEEAGWTSFCRSLFACNEFIYID
jgi:hypothetical protein